MVGSLVEQVRELKARSGGDIGVHASISVAASLLAAGQTLLTLYNGGSFGLSYLLGALSEILLG